MKILILSNKLPYPPRDGGSIASLNMITGLRDAGNELTCLSMNTIKHNYPLDKIPGELSTSVRFLAVDCDSSIRPLRLLLNFLFSRRPYIAERFNTRSFRNKLRGLLSKEQFDLIQLEGPYTGHYLDDIRDLSKACLSLRAHNVEHLIWIRKAEKEPSLLKRIFLKNMASRLQRFEMEVINQSDCLVTISPLDETYFIDKGYKNPVITIPTGLNLAEYPETDLPSEPTLFFIGALDWLPNQEGLLWFLDKVFPDLVSRFPSVVFHVAGRNAPRQFVKRLIHSHIHYHGEADDAREFMQSYRVMIAPLITGSGIRIKILEAMALGRPVVTTSVGAAGIPVTNSQELLMSDNPDLFKNQVLSLLENDMEARGLVTGARKLIKENFDTFGLSARLGQFFKEQV